MYIPKRNLKINGPFEVSFAGASTPPAGPAIIPTSQFGGSHAGQTPSPSVAFEDVSNLGAHDPGIAVGPDHVLICDQKNGIAVYDKTGKLLSFPVQAPTRSRSRHSLARSTPISTPTQTFRVAFHPTSSSTPSTVISESCSIPTANGSGSTPSERITRKSTLRIFLSRRSG